MTDQENTRSIGRRGFLTGSAVGALSLLSGSAVAAPAKAKGKAAQDAPAVEPPKYDRLIKLGIIGCGGRGVFVTKLFAAHGGYKIVACGDYFKDKADALGEQFGVPAERRYSGLSNHKKVLDGDVEAVVIESPPYFHPLQAADAVEAGKHVYVAKPIAVDVPGCLSIEASGRKATDKKLVFLVDFQTRANELYQEAVKRVHNGDIGRLVTGVAVYYCGMIFDTHKKYFEDHAGEPSAKLRAWPLFRGLSGDIITEQNIHSLDVATWILDATPLSAVGTGGRKARTGAGDIFDHFNLVYHFPDDVALSFTSRQFGHGKGDIGCMVFGSRGTIDTHYSADVSIVGETPFKGGESKNLYSTGVVNNIDTFYKSVTEGVVHNPTVAPSVRSNLTTILGRTAAYAGRQVTWDEMLKANEKLELDLTGLEA